MDSVPVINMKDIQLHISDTWLFENALEDLRINQNFFEVCILAFLFVMLSYDFLWNLDDMKETMHACMI